MSISGCRLYKPMWNTLLSHWSNTLVIYLCLGMKIVLKHSCQDNFMLASLKNAPGRSLNSAVEMWHSVSMDDKQKLLVYRWNERKNMGKAYLRNKYALQLKCLVQCDSFFFYQFYARDNDKTKTNANAGLLLSLAPQAAFAVWLYYTVIAL